MLDSLFVDFAQKLHEAGLMLVQILRETFS